MKIHCINNINELITLADKLNPSQYTQALSYLSGSSIGQHFRHIIEIYQSLIYGLKHDEINYDERARNSQLETDLELAKTSLGEIILNLNQINGNKIMTLKGDYACDKSAEINVITSLYREMAYNLEHAIHHQALIRVGLKSLNLENLIDHTFGVAPSTLRYRQSTIIEPAA